MKVRATARDRFFSSTTTITPRGRGYPDLAGACENTRMYLRDLQQKLGGEAVGEVTQPLAGVGTIAAAIETEITFLANPRYRAELSSTRAGAVIVGSKDRDLTSLPRMVVANPYAYFARVAQLFNPIPAHAGGIHPSAVVHESAQIAGSVFVAEFVSVGRGATIGEGAVIGPGCVIGDGVVLGPGTRGEGCEW